MEDVTSEAAGQEQPSQDAYGGFDRLVGLTLVEAGADRVTAELVARPELLQPFGILHGGVLCSLVETVASVGGALWFRDRGQVVGVANTTDFLHAVRDGAALSVVGTPVHRGRTQQLWQVEVREGDRLVARGQVRLANVSSIAALRR